MPPQAPSQRAYHAKTSTPFSCNRVVSFNCRQESVLVVATQVAAKAPAGMSRANRSTSFRRLSRLKLAPRKIRSVRWPTRPEQKESLRVPPKVGFTSLRRPLIAGEARDQEMG